jgi:hypothetical protein
MKDLGTPGFKFRLTPLEKGCVVTWHECLGSAMAYAHREGYVNPVVEERVETEDGIIYREVF